MLTRRQTLVGAGAWGACAAWQTSQCSTGGTSVCSPVTFKVPPNACDAHVHVIGNPEQFPMSPERDYTPPASTAADLADVLHALGLQRVVIIAPTIYGADNSATIDAIAQLGPSRACGVAWLPKNAWPAQLAALKSAGICGFRPFLYSGGTFDPAA